MQLRHEPAALVLSRQAMPTLDRTKYASAAGVAKGAYILADAADGKPEVILMGTGSEVSLCVSAYEQLKKEGVKARVVSMPSWEIFEHQDEAYREEVLPPDSECARLSGAGLDVWLGAIRGIQREKSLACIRSGPLLR